MLSFHKINKLIYEHRYQFFTIILIGYLLFFNTLANNFVLDDIFQIVNNPNIVGWNNTLYFFSNEIGPHYRPLMLTLFALFKNIELGVYAFHFFQISIHITNALLVYLLFNSLLKRRYLSLFLSLVFLVHPINQEVVAYIADLQEVLFVFFGLLGLLLITNKINDLKLFILLPSAQLLALLSKETAILFIFIQGLYTFLFQKKHFIKQLISSFIILVIYFGWRILIFGSINPHKFVTIIPNSPAGSTFHERLMNMPEIVLFYFKTLLFPKDLAASRLWWITDINFSNFYLPLLIEITAIALLILIGIHFYRRRYKDFKMFLFFTSWLLIGLTLHSQIIPLDWTVAERWFYFPIIGLLGLIGLLVKNVKIKSYESKIFIYFLAILVLMLLSTRTFVRNFNWQDQLTLTSHDIKVSKDSPDLMLNLGFALINAGRNEEAIPYLKNAAKLVPEGENIWLNLGNAYANLGQYNKALKYYNKTIEINPESKIAYSNITKAYLLGLKAEKAKELLENTVLIKWPNEQYFWNLLGITNVMLKDNEAALKAFEKAYYLSPNQINSYYYLNLKNGKEVQVQL